ncbi:coatomer subunit beta-1-like [Papaver somniferum]|uniref:coatomer subunit beta-1-like n=1 Tax=Papaver somniferum TaxID=3469 RepID=UPI000E6FA0ED|nr:coatomer subunit beta-1-like [Papaver somniferum]
MEKPCSLLIHFDKGTPALANEIKESLEGSDVVAKVEAMKKAVMLLLNGKVLPEMILICQNLRNKLQHPNVYIRGVTLRFLCRLKETEIIEPLIPSILANLEHRHPFIRRNAILAVMSIYKLPQGEQLLVGAPDMIEKALSSEQDPSAKRNAFLMLFTCAQERAINYLLTRVDSIPELGDYQAAANTYCQLLQSQSDNNVKLIVLDRLNELKTSHREIMVDMIMDVLRALASPNLDVRRKTIDIALELITPRNIDEVVQALKEEVVKTQSTELEKNGEYSQMLVQAIHSCAIKFPEVASTVVHLLIDFLGDCSVASAIDVVVFVREIIETNPKLRVAIIARLLN